MGNRSSLETLPEEVKDEYFKLVRAGRTIDEITDWLKQMGEERSRSAVGRSVKNAREQMQKYREAQEVAKAWIGKLEDDPDSDVGRLLSEMLRVVAFQQISNMGEDDEIKPADIMFLGKAIKELAGADKITVDRTLAIRREIAKQAADKVAHVGKDMGLTSEQTANLKKELLGLVA